MVGEGGGKLLTQTGTANIEHNTLLAQHDADTAWGRPLRVDNDQYAANHALRSRAITCHASHGHFKLWRRHPLGRCSPERGGGGRRDLRKRTSCRGGLEPPFARSP